MRLILLLWCLFVCLLPAASAQRDDTVSVRGLLVAASAEPGPTDERLKPYEATLRRILRFESFRLLGEGRTAVRTPGEATVMLGQNHRLELRSEPSADRGLRMQVNWSQGGRSLMNTGLVLRPGVPAVLGGPPRGEGEVFAVIVVAQ
jgi:hypothetical protein